MPYFPAHPPAPTHQQSAYAWKPVRQFNVPALGSVSINVTECKTAPWGFWVLMSRATLMRVSFDRGMEDLAGGSLGLGTSILVPVLLAKGQQVVTFQNQQAAEVMSITILAPEYISGENR